MSKDALKNTKSRIFWLWVIGAVYRECFAGQRGWKWEEKDTICARKQSPACQQLSHDAAHWPNVHWKEIKKQH